jgi:hypothetical protein
LNDLEEEVAWDIEAAWNVELGHTDARCALDAGNSLVDGSVGAHPMENMLDE